MLKGGGGPSNTTVIILNNDVKSCIHMFPNLATNTTIALPEDGSTGPKYVGE